MNIDNKKYNLLLIAKNDQREGEPITSAYERICKLVSDSTQVNKNPLTTRISHKSYDPNWKKEKEVKGLSPKCTEVFLKIVELDRAGIRWNMSLIAGEMRLKSSSLAPHSKALQRLGYIKRPKTKSGNGWSILRNLDGSSYVSATRVPDGEAYGYGKTENRSSGGQNSRTNSVFRQMNEQEQDMEQRLRESA